MKVVSCYFDNCSASEDYGGGVAAEYLDTVYIYTSLFTKCHGKDINYAHSGGGAVYLNTTYQRHQIHDCDFIGCYSGADGGALHLRNCEVQESDGIANVRLIRCKTLYSADAVEGGAMQGYSAYVTCHFSNCLISLCQSIQGGGMFLKVRPNFVTNIISFCFFCGNTASQRAHDVFFEDSPDEPFLCCFSTASSNRVYPSGNENDWLPLGSSKI